MRIVCSLALTALLTAAFAAPLQATPQFARQYRQDCSFCHLAPPVLNARGEDFLARGYRFADAVAPVPSHQTVPLALWSTLDYERRTNTNKAFPSRVELISAGPLGRSKAAYFIEWRLLSQQIASRNALLNRSGRFEDLFVTSPVGRSPVSVTVGQFRSIAQVDISRRLSISEPAVFSTSLPGPAAASARLTGLRAFSSSGRQPAVRVMWQQRIQDRPADGWYAGVTVPLTGELTIPIGDGASFEVEARPKGVVLESFRRSGLRSAGGHVFVGDDRQLGLAVVSWPVFTRLLVTAAGGLESVGSTTEMRVGVQGEMFFNRMVSAAARIEDRTGAARPVAGVLTLNVHAPFGPAWLRNALRLQVEQRIQAGDHRTLLGLSHVF